MSKTYKDSPSRKASRKGRDRNISVRAVRRDPPDLRKLSRALISLAMAEAAAEAGTQESNHRTTESSAAGDAEVQDD